MKKLLTLLVVGGLLAVGLTGCSDSGNLGGSTSDTFESQGFIVNGSTGTTTTCASSTGVTVKGGIITGCQ